MTVRLSRHTPKHLKDHRNKIDPGIMSINNSVLEAYGMPNNSSTVIEHECFHKYLFVIQVERKICASSKGLCKPCAVWSSVWLHITTPIFSASKILLSE
jgi:hypothetical protein